MIGMPNTIEAAVSSHQLDAVVEPSTHGTGDPEVLGLITGVIDAADRAITQSLIRESRDDHARQPACTGRDRP